MGERHPWLDMTTAEIVDQMNAKARENVKDWDHYIIGEHLNDADPRVEAIMSHGETVFLLECDLTDAPRFAAFLLERHPIVEVP